MPAQQKPLMGAELLDDLDDDDRGEELEEEDGREEEELLRLMQKGEVGIQRLRGVPGMKAQSPREVHLVS